MVSVGTPFQEIAVIARDLAVDLVAIGGYGRKGRGPIEEVFSAPLPKKWCACCPARCCACL
jgi:nucleotide-binding universal stress UspA family protein